MNKTDILNNLNRTFNRAGLVLKKHSPEILVTAGIVGGVASAVMACKATTKVSAILEETKEQVEGIHSVRNTPELRKKYKERYDEEYTEEAEKKDLAITYVQTGIKLAKVYAPAIVLGTLSITAILAGHNILRKRYVATAAAYTMIDKSFKEYRGRVIERFGKELDKELRYNIKAEEVEEIVVNEDGSETVSKTVVNKVDRKTFSEYSRFFDETCGGFEKGNPSYNLLFLEKQQCFLNNKLQANGHLFLNEVYDALGIPRSPIGAVAGWIYDPTDHNIDSFVDFGIFDVNDPDKRAFVNGLEPAILLDFNCQGAIYELI